MMDGCFEDGWLRDEHVDGWMDARKKDERKEGGGQMEGRMGA